MYAYRVKNLSKYHFVLKQKPSSGLPPSIMSHLRLSSPKDGNGQSSLHFEVGQKRNLVTLPSLKGEIIFIVALIISFVYHRGLSCKQRGVIYQETPAMLCDI